MSDQILRMRLRTGTRTRRLALERADLVPVRRTNPNTYPVLLPFGMGQPVRGSATPLGSVERPSVFNLADFPTVVFANTNAELTAALASCTRGTLLVLRNSGDYTYTTTDGFLLYPKTGAGEIAIVSRAIYDGIFPRAATGYNARARLSDSGACARIVVTGNAAASAFYGRTVGHGGPGINADMRGYRFVGVYLTDNGTNYPSNIAVELRSSYGGGESGTFTGPSDEPRNFTWDRCLIENTGASIGDGASFGTAFCGKNFSLVASSVIGMKGLSANAEPKAFAVYPGSGGHYVDNCFLEALGVNWMVGGWDIPNEGFIPSGMVVRRSYMYKRPSWYASFVVQVKNHAEFKVMREAIIEGCVLEGTRAYGQAFSYVHIANNQDAFGNAVSPYIHTVRDITLRYNKFTNIDSGLNLAGGGGGWIYGNTRRARHVLVEQNLIEWAETDSNALRGIQLSMPDAVTLRNNTFAARNPVLYGLEASNVDRCTNATIENNIMEGAWRSDIAIGMTNVVANHFTDATINRNVVSRDVMTAFPNNIKLATDAEILYVNRGTRNYRLQSGSPGKNWGTDGFDVGVDHTGLDALTAGSVSGDW